MREIIVSVSPEGEVKIDAVGFKGKACTEATKALEKALGTVKGSEKKPEFYQATEQRQKAGQG